MVVAWGAGGVAVVPVGQASSRFPPLKFWRKRPAQPVSPASGLPYPGRQGPAVNHGADRQKGGVTETSCTERKRPSRSPSNVTGGYDVMVDTPRAPTTRRGSDAKWGVEIPQAWARALLPCRVGVHDLVFLKSCYCSTLRAVSDVIVTQETFRDAVRARSQPATGTGSHPIAAVADPRRIFHEGHHTCSPARKNPKRHNADGGFY